MKAGQLNIQGIVLVRTLTTNADNGQQTASYLPAGNIWLGRKFLAGNERIASGVEAGEQSMQFWAHAIDATALTLTHRITIGAQVYDVQSIDVTVRGLAIVTAKAVIDATN